MLIAAHLKNTQNKPVFKDVKNCLFHWIKSFASFKDML
tara:strand:+ start:1077 stop:1190 length:114 start_codon:yes stop_codon:yes gene_type:complete